ncbi:MAG: carbon storage regulator CsrA [Solirubrobacterales bacterium]
MAMLVLTRKPGQSIMIGEDVEVQVLSVSGEKVRIGITAPRDLPIHRHEVYERIEDQAAHERAAGGRRGSEPDSDAAAVNGQVEAALQRISNRSRPRRAAVSTLLSPSARRASRTSRRPPSRP